MKKRLFGAAVALLVSGLLLAGCGAEKEISLSEMDADQYVTLVDYNNLDVSVEPPVDEAYQKQVMMDIYNGGFTKDNGGITARAVETGDTVNIDYVGEKDGVAFDGGTAQGALLTIGSGQFIDGFEDGLVGVMPGETAALDLSFPDPYPNNPDLAGQPVVFTVTVNFILPAVDGEEDMKDEIAANAGIEGVSTVEELRQWTYDAIYQQAYPYYVMDLQNAILNELVEKSTFAELPRELLEENKSLISRDLEHEAANSGITADEYADQYGMTKEEFVDYYGTVNTKANLACQSIADKEGLNVNDEELQSLLEQYASQQNYESVEEYMGDYSREECRILFMTDKVLSFLVEKYASAN